MQLKKLLALLLSAAMALSLLAGCGGESVARSLLALLDGKYANVSVEMDPDLEADLRQAIRTAESENAGDDKAAIRAALETLLGSKVTFRKLGEGQQGDTAFDLIFYAGADPDKAAQSAYSQWNGTFSNLPDDGLYTAALAMVETENGVWMLVKATVEKAGTVDKPDSEPVTLQGIAIAQQPDQIKYKDGEAFDPAGMKITATYSDGSTKTIDGTSTDVTFSPETITDGTTSVTVFYGGKQTAVSVECITLNHITVTLNKTEYTVDEELTSQNISVQAVYSDNATAETIEPDKCSFTLNHDPISLPYKFDTVGDYSLTVTYDNLTSDPVNIHVADQNGYHEDNGNYVVTGIDGLQNLFADTTINAASANITLESPVTLGASWPETITFTGELNGNNHKITMTGTRTQGLFNTIAPKGKVLNVDIEVSGTISNPGDRVGAVAGTNGGEISGCDVTISNGGKIDGGVYSAGGVVGQNYKTISDCTVTTEGNDAISGTGSVGGVVGQNYGGTVTACYSTSAVNGTNADAGGVVGRNDRGGSVTACYSTGDVTGEYSGGVVGNNKDGKVTACYHANGTVSGTSAGGVVGQNHGTVTACYSTGAVSGTGSAGGVVGWNYRGGKVTACYSTGDITGKYIGGVVDYNSGGSVTACYWSGSPDAGIGGGNTSGATKVDGTDVTWQTAYKGMNAQAPNHYKQPENDNPPKLNWEN